MNRKREDENGQKQKKKRRRRHRKVKENMFPHQKKNFRTIQLLMTMEIMSILLLKIISFSMIKTI